LIRSGFASHASGSHCAFFQQLNQSVAFQLPHDALRLHRKNSEPVGDLIG